MANLDLTGTGVAIVTPFKKDGSIDFNGLKKLVNHLINGKVEYLVVMGTTGESVTLNKEEKQKVIDCVAKENRKRVPLVLGVGGNDTAEIAKQVSKVDSKIFSAILSVSPYYNKPSQEGIYQHYMALADASPLPLIIYNVPSRTSSNISASTIIRLANDSKKFIAVKDASADLVQASVIAREAPSGFIVLSGDDPTALAAVAVGAKGVISVIANTFPGSFSWMIRFALAGKWDEARKLHYQLLDLHHWLYIEGNPVGIKEAAECKGLISAELRLPLVRMSEVNVKRLHEEMKKLAGSK